MEPTSNDRTGDPPGEPDTSAHHTADVVAGDVVAPDAVTGDAAPGLLDELSDDMAPDEVLAVVGRHVEGLVDMDPAAVVRPAGDIAEVLGRLIEEDDH